MNSNGIPLDLLHRIFKLFSWSLVLFVWARTAWVSDDAFITFRCVENAVTGHGLGFNPGERVQAYTHPLWMLLHLPFQAIFHSPYWTTLALSLLFSGLALATIGRAWQSRTGWVILPLVMMASKAWMEYASSGLENPLTYFLLATFLLVWTRRETIPRHLFWLSFLAGLLLLNRMDTVLMVGPALGLVFWRQRPHGIRDLGAVWQVLCGMLPWILWEVFSLIYYGFPFPNTAYAKLGMGIPQSELWRMGWAYFPDSLTRDPVTLPMIALGILVAFSRRSQAAFGLGMVLYLVYVARIGGDFMTGRFLAAPFLMAVFLVGARLADKPAWSSWMVAGLASVAGLLGPTPMVLSGSTFGKGVPVFAGDYKIADERAVYYHSTGVWPVIEGGPILDDAQVKLGKECSKWKEKVLFHGAIGMFGYHIGPEKYVVDFLGLGDPLYARIPALYKPWYRPGHYRRLSLEGYALSLTSGQNMIADPAVHDWHEKLQLITRGPLFSMKRLLLIWRLNLGIAKPMDLSHLRIPTNQTLDLPLTDVTEFEMLNNMGVKFMLPPRASGDTLSFTFREGHTVNVAWLQAGQPIGGVEVVTLGGNHLPIPAEANAVAMYPDNDWPPTVVGDVRLH